MGAEARVDVISGSSISEAFRTAADLDRYENGSSYTGGLGMASGYRVVSKPLPLYAAEALGERLLSDEQRGPRKWEEAHVIPVTPITKPRHIELEVDVTGLDWSKRKTAIEAAVKPKLRQGEAIESVIFNGGGNWRSDLKGEGRTETKIVKTLGQGKLVKRYLVLRNKREVLGSFATLAEANEWAVKQAERLYDDDSSLSVIAYQRREDKEPLYTYKKVTTKATLYVRATVGIPNGEPKSWVVAGVYSC